MDYGRLINHLDQHVCCDVTKVFVCGALVTDNGIYLKTKCNECGLVVFVPVSAEEYELIYKDKKD